LKTKEELKLKKVKKKSQELQTPVENKNLVGLESSFPKFKDDENLVIDDERFEIFVNSCREAVKK
jgi:Zn-dependent peptidase ImmA (M78 family)